MIVSAKIFTLLLWVLFIANWVSPFGDYYTVLSWAGLALLAAHIIETAVFFPKAKKAGGNLAAHLLQLLIFGYVHNMAIDEKLSQTA